LPAPDKHQAMINAASISNKCGLVAEWLGRWTCDQ